MSWLKPVEKIYQLAGLAKKFLYQQELLATETLPVPVISVGNLSFGGSGKTPTVVFLAKQFLSEKKICVVSKSYKAKASGPGRVLAHQAGSAGIFGDEAQLLARLLKDFPQCEVWAGPNKTETAKACLISEPGLIIVDDGFSHYKLKRNFDLVLVDATQAFRDYQREPLDSLRRADAILITKENLVKYHEVEELRNKIQEQAPFSEDKLFSAQSEVGLDVNPDVAHETPLFLFCGLARPESVLESLKRSGYLVAGHLFFSDHQHYGEKQKKEIEKTRSHLLKSHPNLVVITTEKDAVKINSEQLGFEVLCIRHELTLSETDRKRLVEKIRKSF